MVHVFSRVWKLVLVVGIINALIGLLIFFPIRGVGVLETLVAIMLLLGGLLSGIYAGGLLKIKHDAIPAIVLTVLRVVTGLVILFHPLDTNITFTTLIGIYFGIDGAFTFVEAHRLRGRSRLYVPLLTLSITSILFCALIWLLLKGASFFVVSTLLAVTFWVRAGVQINMALASRNAGAAPPAPGDEPEPPVA